jgi:hypothetical protein
MHRQDHVMYGKAGVMVGNDGNFNHSTDSIITELNGKGYCLCSQASHSPTSRRQSVANVGRTLFSCFQVETGALGPLALVLT